MTEMTGTPLTASIRVTVLDNIEIRTTHINELRSVQNELNLLVNSRVLAKQANKLKIKYNSLLVSILSNWLMCSSRHEYRTEKWMKARRLSEAQVCIAEPDLEQKPRYGPYAPSVIG